MKNIWLFHIEPIDTRYSRQWLTNLKKNFIKQIEDRNLSIKVHDVLGKQINLNTTPGAFLNFTDTNIWKSSQLEDFMPLINDKKVQNGDYVLFLDAWNPSIINIKYTSDLMNLNLKLGGLWHAGSYDPSDFLGRIQDKTWIRYLETSLFHALDHNYFATYDHIDLFCKTYFEKSSHTSGIGTIGLGDLSKIKRTGWPMEYMEDIPFKTTSKKKMILFPHRKAPEKQLDIFQDLAKELPEYEWVVAQDKILSKSEYHTLLSESKIVFSANLQETLGISQMEAIFANSYSMVPDRLSYTEMYYPEFKYPSEWTLNFNFYEKHKENLKDAIKVIMEQDLDVDLINEQKNKLKAYYIPDVIYKTILE